MYTSVVQQEPSAKTVYRLTKRSQRGIMQPLSIGSSVYIALFMLTVLTLCSMYQVVTSDSGIAAQQIERQMQAPGNLNHDQRITTELSIQKTQQVSGNEMIEERMNQNRDDYDSRNNDKQGHHNIPDPLQSRGRGEKKDDAVAIQEDNTVATDRLDDLWHGRSTRTKFTDPHNIPITVVLSHCLGDLTWLKGYLVDFQFQRFTIVSKCGVKPNVEHIPKRTELIEMKNVGRVDHTIAHWMAEVLPQEAQNDNDEIIVFLKDNIFVHTTAIVRDLMTLLSITSSEGFGCALEPRRGRSFFHLTEVLTHFYMDEYTGVRGRKNSPENDPNDVEFKSEYHNMAAWLRDMGISLPKPLTPVCYGGIFAVKRSQIAQVPRQIWRNMERSLSRGDNIEEGHFAERTWAGLLHPRLSLEVMDLLIGVSRDVFHVHEGMRGALMEG